MSPNVSECLWMSPNVSKMSRLRHFPPTGYTILLFLTSSLYRYMSDLPTCKSKELLQFSNVSSIGFTLLDNIRRERNRAAWRRLERIEYNVVGMYLDVSSTYFFSWDKYWLFGTINPVQYLYFCFISSSRKE